MVLKSATLNNASLLCLKMLRLKCCRTDQRLLSETYNAAWIGRAKVWFGPGICLCKLRPLRKAVQQDATGASALPTAAAKNHESYVWALETYKLYN
ncbi:hypothetical protein NBRC116601_21000 [Cognatishimia sp. WU-CL00825]